MIALLTALVLGWWLWTPDLPRPTLEAKYLEQPGDLITVGPWRLHVRDRGPREAPAILLVHGFGSSLHTWEAWTQTLQTKHRVIAIDLPGSGLSFVDPNNDVSDERALTVLIALQDHLGLKRWSIGGHSMGGRIAWKFAAMHPDRVDRLVLVAPDGFASAGFEYGKVFEVPAYMHAIRQVLPRTLVRMSMKPAYYDPAMLTDTLVDRYYDLLRAPGARQALLERLRQTIPADPTPLLATIRAPTLLVWGAHDAMIPANNAADYLKAMRAVNVPVVSVQFPKAGHLPQEEAATESAAAVAQFLAY